MQTTSHKQSHRTPDGVQTKSEDLHEDQMVESVPQVKFKKECGFLAIMDTDPQVKFDHHFCMNETDISKLACLGTAVAISHVT